MILPRADAPTRRASLIRRRSLRQGALQAQLAPRAKLSVALAAGRMTAWQAVVIAPSTAGR
jgi:hemolysin activation/secretion protein